MTDEEAKLTPAELCAVDEGTVEWLVVENTPGYLPDSEPAGFQTWTEAHEYAESLVDDLTNGVYDEDYYVVAYDRNRGYWYLERSPNDLGRVITIERAE